jgi:hypothetical protein
LRRERAHGEQVRMTAAAVATGLVMAGRPDGGENRTFSG